jgi:hypothetical protein
MRKFLGALLAIGALTAAPAVASDLPTKKPPPEPVVTPPLPSAWVFEITGYGWATNLAGNAGVGPYPVEPFFVPFAKVIEHFDGALMSAFVARNDMFIGGVDLILARLKGGINFNNPESALYGDHADVKLTESIVTAFGGLRIPIGPPNHQLYGTVGAR